MTNDRDKTQPFSDQGAGREETLQTKGGLTATAFGLTDVGVQRSVNQDTLGNRVGQHKDRMMDLGLLYAVADGMGGHARGEVASALAIQHLFAHYYDGDPQDDPRRMLEKVLIETNAAVHQAGRESGGAAMGTTLTMALLRNNTLFVGNIGDSRTYCIRRGQIEQLTHDHSLIGEQVRNGLLTEAQAKQSSIRNVITRAVGYREEVEPDVFTFEIETGDIVLLCSDGLHSMVDNHELAQHLSMQPLGVAVPALIELAKQRGGPDNITALAVRIDAINASAGARDDATTVPLGPSLNDAVTKPFTRADGSEETRRDVPAIATMAAPAAQAPPPAAPPVAPPPAAPPASPIAPAPPRSVPPARRSSGRFPVVFLIVLPLLLLAVAGAGLVAIAGNDDDPGTVGTTAPVATQAPSNTPTGASASQPASAAGSGALPSASAAPSAGVVGASPTRSPSSGIVSTPNTSAVAPAATATNVSAGGSENTRTIISGMITLIGQPIQATDFEIVIYLASDIPGIAIGNDPPVESQLIALTPTWVGAVTAQSAPLLSYEARGEWTSPAKDERAIIALRRKATGQIVYPEREQWLVTLNDTQPLTNHALVFTRLPQ